VIIEFVGVEADAGNWLCAYAAAQALKAVELERPPPFDLLIAKP
jgi:hypothetical protein